MSLFLSFHLLYPSLQTNPVGKKIKSQGGFLVQVPLWARMAKRREKSQGSKELGIDLCSALSHLAWSFSSLTSLHPLPLKKEPKNYMAGVWVPCQDP